jgi:putative SOS response-associated peptidase YedK
MCTRYALDMTWVDWQVLYGLSVDGPPPWNFQPNYSVTLTSDIPVVMHRDGKRVFERMRWGIVPSFRRSTYNTRDDTVEKSELWKRIWRQN